MGSLSRLCFLDPELQHHKKLVVAVNPIGDIFMPIDVVDLLTNLIRIPSVNPMGRDAPGARLESDVTDYLQTVFEKTGVAWKRQHVAPLRENIYAVLPGTGSTIMFEAHQDTVPVDGMTIAPFSGEVRDGRVYGRGACDVKGGMACMIAAFAGLAENRDANSPTLIMACTVNEEHGFSGATALARRWSSNECELLPHPPHSVVVAEPTSLNVVGSHKGVVRWRAQTRGVANHSSDPSAGHNAIYDMARVVWALEQYAAVAGSFRSHPLHGGPTLSVGLISGGISVNTVPDSCTIEIDRRLLPGEDAQQARDEVIAFVEQLMTGEPSCAQMQLEHHPPYIIGTGLPDDKNQPLAAQLVATAQECGAESAIIAVPFGTDAAAYTATAPSVVFGPGSIEQAHTPDEYIEVSQLHKAVEILTRFARKQPPQATQ